MTDLTTGVLVFRKAAASRLRPEGRALVDAHLVAILEELFGEEKPPLRTGASGRRGICLPTS